VEDIRFQYSIRTILLIFVVAALAAGFVTYFPRLWMEAVAVALVMSGCILIFSHEHPLGFFLRYINPLIAVVVLAICVVAATCGDGSYEGLFQGFIPTYFLAKGIFCSVALFLLGKLLELMISKEP